MPKTKIKEEQRFRNPGLIALLLVFSALVLFRFGAELLGDDSSLLTLGITGLIGIVLAFGWYAVYRSRLRIKLSKKHLKVRVKGPIGRRLKLPTEDVVDHRFVDVKPAARWSGSLNHPSADFRSIDFGKRRGLLLKMRCGRSYFIGSDDLFKQQKSVDSLLST